MVAPVFSMTDPVGATRYRVLYGDTDAGGVVYYGAYLRFLEMGRTEYMREMALPYSLVEEQGILMPVTECHVCYRFSAKYDDLLRIETSLARLKKASCTFHYRILREGDPGRLLVTGATTHAAVNDKGRPVPLPSVLVEQLSRFV